MSYIELNSISLGSGKTASNSGGSQGGGNGIITAILSQQNGDSVIELSTLKSEIDSIYNDVENGKATASLILGVSEGDRTLYHIVCSLMAIGMSSVNLVLSGVEGAKDMSFLVMFSPSEMYTIALLNFDLDTGAITDNWNVFMKF